MAGDEIRAGWYPDVERPGGERWWDGSSWTEHRRAAGSATPDAGSTPDGAPSGWGAPTSVPTGYRPYASSGYAKSSNAGLALVLSIVGLVCCQLLSVVGLVLGRKTVNEVDEGLVDPSARGTAQAAFVIGIIGSVLLAIGLVIVVLFLVAVGS